MSTGLKSKILWSFSLLVYLSGMGFFYYKYVPLIKSFQAALIPILFIIIITTAVKVEWGALFFVFCFPLINNLPYFFGIGFDIPHAPTALVLSLAFFLGWLINKLFSGCKVELDFPASNPLLLLSLIVLASAIITFIRYANFYPLVSSGFYDLVVNVNGVRAGGALMSIVFASLNYLTGFGLFFVLISSTKDQKTINRVLIALSLAIAVSLIFAFIQKYGSIKLGNTPFWVSRDQINSTFKDPNSFGAFLAAFFPVLLGMALSFKGKLRLFCIGLIILTIYVFPWTGLRSGFLAISISLVVFSLLVLVSARISGKKKLALAATLIIIFVIFLAIVFAGQAQTILAKRLGWSLNFVKGDITLSDLFTEKLRLWEVASSMVKDYPLTGVGAGAYIVELPNYSKLMGYPYRWTDSAENYFFQVGSELGLIGLILILWIFYEIIKQMRKVWKQPEKENPARQSSGFIAIGICLGILSIWTNFLFHSFIGSYEVIYLFWLLVALIFALSKAKKERGAGANLNPKFKVASLILVLFFGAVHLWNSSHSLSLHNRTEKLALKQDFGLYAPEKDERRFSFQWARKTAGREIDIYGPTLVFPVMASHPDIEKRPVSVRIYLADRNYRKEGVLKEIRLHRKEWHDVELGTSEFFQEKIQLIIETSREWFPYKMGIPDARRLAVALGEEWFRYPEELTAEKVKSIQKIPSRTWKTPEGIPDTALYSNGRRQIELNIEEQAVAIRLFIRGRKALGLGPFIVIKLDGQIIAKTMLTHEEWTPLVLTPEIAPGSHNLEVEFTNDLHKPELQQDRNVFLGDVEVIYLK